MASTAPHPQTWTRGAGSEALAAEVNNAMDAGVHVLLAHEMPGTGGQETRFGCEFSSFFSCPDGATPSELLHRGIYSQIAVPLKGGAWREASMVLLGIELGLSKGEVADNPHLHARRASTSRKMIFRAASKGAIRAKVIIKAAARPSSRFTGAKVVSATEIEVAPSDETSEVEMLEI